MPHFVLRHLLLASTALAAPMVCAAAAHAADAPTPPAKNTTEIVVTATRQSQALSKVPLSVSAFTAAKMDVLNVKSFADLAKYTPGVTFNEDRHDVSIRGIESTAGSGTTGIYIDDTPIQVRALGLNANNTLPTVFDLQRVEVLRGPQGTLFGAGSEGGTVRYITTQPSLNKFSATAHSEFATTENGDPSYEFGAAAGGPIVADKLGFRVSAWGRHDGGYVDRVDNQNVGGVQKNANWVDTYVLRAAVTWQPTADLGITPAINYEKRDQHNHDEYWVSISNPGSGQYRSGTPDRMEDSDRFYLPSLKIDWTIGPVKFISDTAYYNRRELVNGYSATLYNLSYFQHYTEVQTDPAGNPCATAICNAGGELLTATGLNLPGFGPYVSRNWITNAQENFTQEFRLQSNTPGSRLTWSAGLFYSHNNQRSTEEIRDPQLPSLTQYLWYGDNSGLTQDEMMLNSWGELLLPNGDDYINDTKAHDRQIAIFGDATYNLTEALKLTLGFRYAWTHFDYHNLTDGAQEGLGGPYVNSGKKDETPLTPKVGLTYQINPDDMVYGTISKGYRIGGAVPTLPPFCEGTFPTQYNSDSVLSYEVGSKNRFFDRKLSLSGSLYLVKWRNIQQAFLVPTCGIQYTTNAGTAISQGFDLEGQWQVTDNFDIELSTGYNDAHFTKTYIDPTVGEPVVLKGDALDVAPWTVTVGAQYNFLIADHAGYVRADYEFNSRRDKPIYLEDPRSIYYDSGLRPDPATNLVSARAGVTLDRWDLALYANNLFNAHPQLNLQHQDSGTALFEASTFRPRTIGIAASFKY